MSEDIAKLIKRARVQERRHSVEFHRELYGALADALERLTAERDEAHRQVGGLMHQRDYWQQRYDTQHRTVHRLEAQRDALAKALRYYAQALPVGAVARAALAEAGLE